MVDLRTITIPAEVLGLVPKNTALEHEVLPLAEEAGALRVAVAEGCSPDVPADIAFLVGKRVIPEPREREVLLEAIQRFYGGSTKRNHGCLPESVELKGTHRQEGLQREPAFTGSAVGLADSIIADAIRMKASDIHVEPQERILRVRFRLDGVLHEMSTHPASVTRPLVSRLKIMADLDIAEKRRPQDGRIRARDQDRTIDIRVSTLPTDFGEKVVLRILDRSAMQLDLGHLGFESSDRERFEKTIRLPYGMILVTGPTGSGKTTTLYAALHQINKASINITTIEDPIEYNLPGINQTHVRSEIGLTFAAALRSILRQDPNVIMVGEIRDTETAEIAIRAALTGHLVFSTLHTNDAASAITRLVDMGVEPFLVASALRLILAQRLLRRTCSCSKGESTGCHLCHGSGYKGRVAVFEVLPVDESMCQIIMSGGNITLLREAGARAGRVSLRAAALKKVTSGITTFDEVERETVEE